MSKYDRKLCEGCISYNSFDKVCMYHTPRTKGNQKCPCVNCIVKTMCIETCDDFFNLIRYEWPYKGDV